ncbi:hypothetical protein Cs308_0711 [Candidatus Chlamydia sanziniae]|uniref:Uncharacterized protein n=1 Tax=Candidatus Chlamydia sanziniae TaxID=1806891 RepID=A0A1A9HWR5_9CHLA|nr:hypothetical protein Cs308_0711 [Candidatus Chlamydia sanziniae]
MYIPASIVKVIKLKNYLNIKVGEYIEIPNSGFGCNFDKKNRGV